MTNDFRQGIQFNDYSIPRDYHFYRVVVTVTNKSTMETISSSLYLSAKRSIKWLTQQVTGTYYYPLPVEFFKFQYDIQEVEDSDTIVFNHVTTKESVERSIVKFIMYIVLSKRWRKHKVKNFLKNIRTFLNNHIFIYRKAKITIQTV